MTDIQDFFTIEPISDGMFETPCPVIDLDIAERNLRRWQARCDNLGLANRPHVKTHKLTGLARFQIALGACGITVQKLGEAEVMADAGISDMLITFNIVGAAKPARLTELGDARVYKINEEHGYLDISALTTKPAVGDMVDILPNHVCPVSNLYDKVALMRGGRVLGLTRVDARGLVW
jgi:D-serine deaminase-like pyridoxal phosphate-dependent protein